MILVICFVGVIGPLDLVFRILIWIFSALQIIALILCQLYLHAFLCSYLFFISFITYARLRFWVFYIQLQVCSTFGKFGLTYLRSQTIPLYRNRIKLNILHYNIKCVQCFSFQYNRKNYKFYLFFSTILSNSVVQLVLNSIQF